MFVCLFAAGSLYRPLKSSEPFFLTLVLFSELINVGVFSYPLYLSTLIARGEANSPIVPRLPFFRGESEPPPESPMESDTEELSLKISLPALPGLVFGGHSPQKKACIKQEEVGTISPSLPDRFGSQDNLLDPFDTINSTLITPDTSIHIKVRRFFNSLCILIEILRIFSIYYNYSTVYRILYSWYIDFFATSMYCTCIVCSLLGRREFFDF